MTTLCRENVQAFCLSLCFIHGFLRPQTEHEERFLFVPIAELQKSKLAAWQPAQQVECPSTDAEDEKEYNYEQARPRR